ncbi:hypothetical protein SLEP1_g24554 [Rubroshorea leprosula]|uniref:Uncharacterized protein n=1 Tax=Rubroshorea leprosula TaxID=152421 RepID=A0AAV5JM87_9ROSI|nr:hypothetical protein SLEP1_g24554 [Rubroshorea leprosula]
MSSKETVSVIGSEVMPLEYGGMDLESSPSSSERTVEEVGGREGMGGGEVVGVGGDSVPITVVEVEGRRERCYDVDADIVEEEAASWGRGEGVLCSSGSLDACMWGRGDAEVEVLSSWKVKRANQNKFGLNEDEEEEVGMLVRESGNLVNIMYLTSAKCIEAAELYGPSALSEAEMDNFLGVVGGVAIPKKPRKKSKTSTKQVDEEGVEKEVVPSTSAGVEEEVPRLELKRKGTSSWQGKGPCSPVVLLEQLVRGEEHDEGQEVHQFHLSQSGQALRMGRGSESASWVNSLAQEFMESVKERSFLQKLSH